MGKVNKEKVKRKTLNDPLDNFILPELAEVLEIEHHELILLMEYDRKWLTEELKRRGII
jgi:hypothetical protein